MNIFYIYKIEENHFMFNFKDINVLSLFQMK